jgi:hypothetical protein
VVDNIEVDCLSCNQRMASQPLVDDMDDAESKLHNSGAGGPQP